MNFNQPYPNPYQPTSYQNPYLAQQHNNGINWVQGIEGAKAYQLQPNSNVMMLDSENDGVFYIKISDNVGMCTLRTFKYQEVTTTSTSPNLSDYVRKEDLKSEVETLVNSMLGGSNEQSVSATKSNKTITN